LSRHKDGLCQLLPILDSPGLVPDATSHRFQRPAVSLDTKNQQSSREGLLGAGSEIPGEKLEGNARVWLHREQDLNGAALPKFELEGGIHGTQTKRRSGSD